MDIYELRRKVTVTMFTSFWNNNSYGIFHYSVDERHNVLKLQPRELEQELQAIGSIAENISQELFYKYQISQWDALNIVIRFELAREQEKEIDNSDIFKAIANIIKPTSE